MAAMVSGRGPEKELSAKRSQFCVGARRIVYASLHLQALERGNGNQPFSAQQC